MRSFLYIAFLALTATLSSCEKDEKLYDAPVVPVGIQTATFAMGENYENQLWFEFSTQQTSSNPFGLWDIAFSTDETNRILVNAGRHSSYGVAMFEGMDFRDIVTIDPAKQNWMFDNPNWHTDSLAFSGAMMQDGPGKYSGKKRIYVINRGADSLGVKKFIKLKVCGREGGVYHFQWSLLEDTTPANDIYLRVDTDHNFAYYNFSMEKEVYNEPRDNNSWDIMFTTYKEPVYEESTGKYLPYVLRGIISNPNKVKVCELNNKIAFEKIDLSYAKGLNYSNDANIIGYDWKIWSLTANKYTVDQNKVFIIVDTKGNYFKMKVVDFYDDQGRKGYPKLAWELLK